MLVDPFNYRSAATTTSFFAGARSRSHRQLDLLIVVVDGSESVGEEDLRLLAEVGHSRHIVALNKSDLPTFATARLIERLPSPPNCSALISVSARSETGLESLRAAILAPFANGSAHSEGLLITNARHHDLLVRSIEAIVSSEHLLEERASEEIVLVGLHSALRYVGEITGQTTTDEILGQIFSTFCIGK